MLLVMNEIHVSSAYRIKTISKFIDSKVLNSSIFSLILTPPPQKKPTKSGTLFSSSVMYGKCMRKTKCGNLTPLGVSNLISTFGSQKTNSKIQKYTYLLHLSSILLYPLVCQGSPRSTESRYPSPPLVTPVTP
jgi:hypothetical protein